MAAWKQPIFKEFNLGTPGKACVRYALTGEVSRTAHCSLATVKKPHIVGNRRIDQITGDVANETNRGGAKRILNIATQRELCVRYAALYVGADSGALIRIRTFHAIAVLRQCHNGGKSLTGFEPNRSANVQRSTVINTHRGGPSTFHVYAGCGFIIIIIENASGKCQRKTDDCNKFDKGHFSH